MSQTYELQATPARLISQRNELLQSTMRKEKHSFSIADEYPIVLSHDHLETSFSFVESDQPIAHANLWQRTMLLPHTSYQVGLVGNVATHPKLQGRGVMKNLLQQLEDYAIKNSLKALILWSDLELFYQKRGYQSLSQEWRYTFQKQKDFSTQAGRFFIVDSQSLRDEDLSQMLALRAKVPTLERQIDEFRSLLAIPHTYCLMSVENQMITSYLIVGKGADMGQVIHEWGASDPALLIESVQALMEIAEWEECTLLSPYALPSVWRKKLDSAALQKENHPMALYKPLGEDIDLNRYWPFIWGLDSI